MRQYTKQNDRQTHPKSAPLPAADDYAAFLDAKSQHPGDEGFEPDFFPDAMFDFQRALLTWACKRGRAAIFADCGMGKTLIQLAWAENVWRHTGGRVLILTPLAVGAQTVAQGERFGIKCERSRDGALGDCRIAVANYEMLHKFRPEDFAACVLDESSCIKHATGATQKRVTRFMARMKFRLLCTATAAPNDYVELGTSSEALGELGHSDMLARFFRQTDNKGHRMQELKEQKAAHRQIGGNFFGKLSFRAAQAIGQWKLKAHAEIPFWRWVATWAWACRKPSDLGFPDAAFLLPGLEQRYHVVKARRPADGMLFTVPAFGLGEEREERKRTLDERCECVAQLVNHRDPAIVWVQYNQEGDLCERLIGNAVQVSGSDSDDEKEAKLARFIAGDSKARVLISKAKIAGWGLNLQHCRHVVTFVSHSYESYYQAVRRCWRFGQTRPVTVDIVATEGEQRVMDNMARKSAQADEMFARIVQYMTMAQGLRIENGGREVEVPKWLS